MTATPSAPPLTPARRNHATVLAVFLIALLALRVLSLAVSETSLGFDEAQYWAWSKSLTFGYFTKPPLIAWLIGGTTALCGDSALCVRMPAMLLHTGTAILLYLGGRRLYDWSVGFWAAIFYGITPGVAVSSILITTDVPLIFLWSIALLAFHDHLRAPRLGTGLVLGLAIGLGLNAKYAMIFFIACAVLYVLTTRSAWKIARAPSTWLALLIAVLAIAPNLAWNLSNGFATFDHTVSDNMAWRGFALHPVRALEFIATQFGVLGPVVFGAYLVILFARRSTDRPDSDRLLIFMSLPVFALITGQALMSHAEANWSATAMPATVILVAAHLAMSRHRASFRWSVAVNAAFCAVVIASIAVVAPSAIPRALKPVQQIFGGDALRADLIGTLQQSDVTTVVVRGRAMTAEVIYALRDTPYEVRAYRSLDAAPTNDFEKTRPWTPGMDLPIAIVLQAGADKPEDLAGDPRLIGTIESPEYALRYGALDIWRIDPAN